MRILVSAPFAGRRRLDRRGEFGDLVPERRDLLSHRGLLLARQRRNEDDE